MPRFWGFRFRLPRRGGTQPSAAILGPTTGIGAWLPDFDVGERHEVHVGLAPWDALRVALAAPAAPDAFVGALFRLRGLKPEGSIEASMAANGFTVLERTAATFVVGLIPGSRKPTGDPREWWETRRRSAIRIAADIRAEPDGAGSRLITETRVASTGRRSRLLFGLYWLGVGPFSKFIRRRWLRAWAAASP